MTAVPKPMPREGSVAKRWERWRKEQRTRVAVRARGKCEACGTQGERLDWAHLAGRRNIVSEPWASSEMLTCALCRQCHRDVDEGRNPEVLTELRWQAAADLSLLVKKGVFGFHFAGRTFYMEQIMYDDPLDVIRTLIRHAEAEDIEP